MNREPSIRKAAVLVASLDADTADLLLAQMPPEQADRVRREVLELGDIDPAEQQRVVDEFFRIGPLVPEHDPPGLDLDDHLLSGIVPPIDEYIPASRPDSTVDFSRQEIRYGAGQSRSLDFLDREQVGQPSGERLPAIEEDDRLDKPFSFLQDAEPEALVPLLEREHPQAIALVLAHLPPERGHVLARLPANMQTDVIQRLVDLEETDPRVLREVEQAVAAWLQKRQPVRRRVAGMAAVSAILDASEKTARRQILNNLTVHDRPLAHKLTPAPPLPRRFTFAELCQLPLEALMCVVRATDRRTAVLALAGTSAELVQDLLDCLSPEEADSLSRRLTNLGPLRLVDIDRAQTTWPN